MATMSSEDVNVAQIDSYMRANNVYDSIRKVLGDQKDGKAIAKLQSSGLLDQALHHLQLAKSTNHRMIPGKRYLHMRINPGKAFVDHIVREELQAAQSTLTVICHFGSHSYRSRPVASTVEPLFDQSFIIPLQDEHDASPKRSLASLVSFNQPIQMMVIRETAQGKVTIVATHELEWRKVLVHGRLALPVELQNQDDPEMPVGLMDIDLEIVPLKMPPISKVLPVFVEQKLVVSQLRQEKELQLDIARRFQAYAQAWWEDYQQIRALHQNRLVKLFAKGEDGKRRFVSTFVGPIMADRCLDSPLHAARFVRLIPYKKDQKLGERTEIWNKPAVMLARRWGDVEDHATLLCSLLLGFGLDAYVCVGTNNDGAHMWVMTISDTYEVEMWESLTGQRFLLPPVDAKTSSRPKTEHPFKTIHALFNDKSFYANTQLDDGVDTCRFVLSNGNCWKTMNQAAIAVLPRTQSISIPPPSFDTFKKEQQVERKLQQLITHFRKEQLGVSTVFESAFSYILQPALSAYEIERLSGVCPGNEHFSQSIKNYIPVNHVFKGVPFQFTHVDPRIMFQKCLANETMVDVIKSRGDEMRFGIRVKIVPYPANFCCAWVMIACKYREVPL